MGQRRDVMLRAALLANPGAFTVGHGRRYRAGEMSQVDPELTTSGQWPIDGTASSQYSSTWGADAIVGPPRVYPRCGDLRGAWAPRRRQSAAEWIEARYAAAPAARSIRVFETNCPGATYAVTVWSGQVEQLVWQDQPVALGRAARVLEVDLPRAQQVRRVRAYVANSWGGWAEIDTIGLARAPRVVSPYRSLPASKLRGRPRAVERSELPYGLGVQAAERGQGKRFTVREMLSRDWRVRWRGEWPEAARASSSFGMGWSARRICGTPGIYPLYGDLPGAWAPSSALSGMEWVEADFGARRPLSRFIRVFETWNPGATFAVTIKAPWKETLVWSGTPARAGRGAKVLEIRLARPRRIRCVRVYVDNSLWPGWTEIDSVGLLGDR